MFEDRRLTLQELKGALDANFGYPVGGNPHSAAAKSSLGEQDIYEVVKRIIDRHGSLNPAEIKTKSIASSPASLRRRRQEIPRYEEIRHILENSPCLVTTSTTWILSPANAR